MNLFLICNHTASRLLLCSVCASTFLCWFVWRQWLTKSIGCLIGPICVNHCKSDYQASFCASRSSLLSVLTCCAHTWAAFWLWPQGLSYLNAFVVNYVETRSFCMAIFLLLFEIFSLGKVLIKTGVGSDYMFLPFFSMLSLLNAASRGESRQTGFFCCVFVSYFKGWKSGGRKEQVWTVCLGTCKSKM